nr:hypothetical protein [uncultured bacterium]
MAAPVVHRNGKRTESNFQLLLDKRPTLQLDLCKYFHQGLIVSDR